jgi:hypothetical protein
LHVAPAPQTCEFFFLLYFLYWCIFKKL